MTENKNTVRVFENGGRRWYDANKMVWALFGVVGTLVGIVLMMGYNNANAKIHDNKTAIQENRIDIKKVENLMIEQRVEQTRIFEKLGSIEQKIDNQ